MRHLFPLALMCAAALAISARAEKADHGKPIHIESDRVTVDDVKQLAVFIGGVTLTQGTMTIRGDRMEVHKDKAGFRIRRARRQGTAVYPCCA
jgi:lipopolysaccharide export system protein LptA